MVTITTIFFLLMTAASAFFTVLAALRGTNMGGRWLRLAPAFALLLLTCMCGSFVWWTAGLAIAMLPSAGIVLAQVLPFALLGALAARHMAASYGEARQRGQARSTEGGLQAHSYLRMPEGWAGDRRARAALALLVLSIVALVAYAIIAATSRWHNDFVSIFVIATIQALVTAAVSGWYLCGLVERVEGPSHPEANGQKRTSVGTSGGGYVPPSDGAFDSDDAVVGASSERSVTHENTKTSIRKGQRVPATPQPQVPAPEELVEQCEHVIARYLDARQARDTDAMRAAFVDMVTVRDQLVAPGEAQSVPSYYENLGYLLTLMASWRLEEGDIDLDEGGAYALEAIEALARATERGVGDLGTIRNLANMSRVWAGYVAWSQDRRSDFANLLADGPYNAFTYAMMGHIMMCSALEEADANKAYMALQTFQLMDRTAGEDFVPGGVKGRMYPIAISAGYAAYGTLLAQGRRMFETLRAEDDVPAAISVLERGRAFLAEPETYAHQIDDALARVRGER